MHGNQIVQYLPNYKRHEFDQGHSTKLLESSASYIQMENTKTTRILFKGTWILTYVWHSRWHYLGFISGKAAKPHFLESPQKSLKIRQHSCQKGCPLRNNNLLKIWKICVFFGGSLFKWKNCWHLEFLINQVFEKRFIIFKKMRYRGQLLLKLRAVEVATLFHWISSRST